MITRGKTVNFLGDSITYGEGASSPDKIYCRIAKELLGLKAANNYGISGTRIARQAKVSDDPNFVDRYFASRIDIMESDADIIVVFGGTNDYGSGYALMGTPEDRTPVTFYGACHDLFIRLKDKYPHSAIVVLTPLHRFNEDDPRGDGSKDKDYPPLRTYVEVLREVAGYYSLPICDLYEESASQPRVPPLTDILSRDGLHPSDIGHRFIAGKLTEFLKDL